MYVVLSLGGSLINTENGIDHKFLDEVKKILDKSSHSFGIVTGGGTAARVYAQKARQINGNEFEADEAAIKATKENAKHAIDAFGKLAYSRVLENFDDARNAASASKIIVMGGTIPGITTDSDAALLAEALHAKRLVNISNVNGIYDSNPSKNPNAKKYDKLSYDELIKLASTSDSRKAGENFVFDILACKLVSRSRIETHFVSGKNLDDLKNAIEGKEHGGTVVKE
ncbi:MAG: UMP kinase [Candidatus Micrarchaeota archaeon]|nr:UMP kinase [Candidatus Micrarchaeota archaeon]